GWMCRRRQIYTEAALLLLDKRQTSTSVRRGGCWWDLRRSLFIARCIERFGMLAVSHVAAKLPPTSHTDRKAVDNNDLGADGADIDEVGVSWVMEPPARRTNLARVQETPRCRRRAVREEHSVVYLFC